MIAVAVAEEKKEDNVKHVFVQLHFGADAIIGEEAVGKKLEVSHTYSLLGLISKQSVNLVIDGIDI